MNINQRLKSLLDMIDIDADSKMLSDMGDVRLPEILKGKDRFLKDAIMIDYKSKTENVQASNTALLVEQLEIVLQILLNKDFNIVLCPSSWGEVDACKKFAYVFQNNKVLCMDRFYSMEEIAGIIQESRMCISMSKEISILSAALCKPFLQINCDEVISIIAEKLDCGQLALNTDAINAGKVINAVDYLHKNYVDIVNILNSVFGTISETDEPDKREQLTVDRREMSKLEQHAKTSELVKENNVCCFPLPKDGVRNNVKNILYLGWLGKGNVGDEVLFELFKSMFYKYHQAKSNDYVVNIDTCNCINNYKIDTSTYNLIVLGGGSLIISPFYLKICEDGIKHGVPIVSWGTGLDGFYKQEHLNLIKLSEQNLNQFKAIYEQFDYISVRGPFTKNMLINTGLKKEIHEIGDPALAYVTETYGEQLEVSESSENKNILINWGTSYNNVFGKNELMLEVELAAVIRLLISKGYMVTVYPIWTEDINPVKQLAKKVNDSRCQVITEVYEAKILQRLISQSYLSINLKLHANILAAAANRPFISLAYRGKCFDFAKSVNCLEYAVATDQVTSEKIMELVRDIENNYDAIIKRIKVSKKGYYPKLIGSFYIMSDILNKQNLKKVESGQNSVFDNTKDNVNHDDILHHECCNLLNYINRYINDTIELSNDYKSVLKNVKQFLDKEVDNTIKEYLEIVYMIINDYFTGQVSDDVFSFYLKKQYKVEIIEIERTLKSLNLLKERAFGKKCEDGLLKTSIYPKVSVIITTYNRKYLLEQSINSVLKQDYPNVKIIVIDDCSTDGTHALMKERFINESTIIYMRNENNVGPGNNRRNAFKTHADGDYVMFLDDDDYLVDMNYITKAVNFHNNHPEVSFVAANVFLEFSKTNQLKPSILNLSEVTDKYEYFINFQKHEYPKPVSTLTAMFKRDSLVKAGIFDMEMVNDASIYLRSLLEGDAGFIDVIAGVYRIHGNNITFNLTCDFIIKNLEEKITIKNIAIEKYKYDRKKMNEWLDYNVQTTISYFLSNSAKNADDVKAIYLWAQKNCPNIIRNKTFTKAEYSS